MSKESTGMVTFRFDPENPPELTAEEKQAWDSLQNLRDEDIDLTDMPEVTTGWRRAHPQSQSPASLVPEENKQQITLRLDADVLAFFKGTGRRYQSRINAALRAYMLAHKS